MKTRNSWYAALHHLQIAFKAASKFNLGRAEKHRIISMEHTAIAHNFGMIPSTSDKKALKRRQTSLGITIENARQAAAPDLDGRVLLLDG